MHAMVLSELIKRLSAGVILAEILDIKILTKYQIEY